MKTDKIRYGIVGVGKQGSYYCLRFLAHTETHSVLTAVCDIDPERRNWAQKHLKNVKVFSDYRELLKSGLVDVVMVETPHCLHAQIAVDAFKEGLNVLIDKPAGVEAGEIAKLNAEADKHPDCLFGIMYNQRTNRLYVKAKQLIDGGALGEITRVNWIITDWYRPQAYFNQGGWRGTWAGEGGGALINQCPHQLDLFTWMFGLPVSVYSAVKTVGRDILVENDVTAMVEFQNGASGVIVISTHDTPGTNRLEVTGTRGKMVIEGRKLTLYKLDVSEPDFSRENKKFMGKPSLKKSSSIKNAVQLFTENVNPGQHFKIVGNFTAVLQGREKALIAPGKEGINGLTLSNAIHLSGWTNEKIALPLDYERFKAELHKKIEEEKALSRAPDLSWK